MLAHAASQLAPAERLRLRAFVALMCCSAVWGGIAAMSSRDLAILIGALLLLPPYLTWVASDLRVRRVRGVGAWLQFVLAAPGNFGLLIYLLLSRGVHGALIWLAMGVACMVPAGLAALLARGVWCFASGEPF